MGQCATAFRFRAWARRLLCSPPAGYGNPKRSRARAEAAEALHAQLLPQLRVFCGLSLEPPGTMGYAVKVIPAPKVPLARSLGRRSSRSRHSNAAVRKSIFPQVG